MTDEKTETTFGINLTEANQEYVRATTEAEEVYRTVYDAVYAKQNAAVQAVRGLLEGDGIPEGVADPVIALIKSLVSPQRKARLKAADEARTRLLDAADQKRKEAADANPFTRRVNTLIRRQYGESYVTPLLENAPFTFASLRKLANEQRWCTDYETVMSDFVRAGALPEETRTVTRRVDWSIVPRSHSPQEGETWVARMTLPSYVRDTTLDGEEYDFSELRNYVTLITYEKTDDTPSGS